MYVFCKFLAMKMFLVLTIVSTFDKTDLVIQH